jgi:hypothetical protein
MQQSESALFNSRGRLPRITVLRYKSCSGLNKRIEATGYVEYDPAAQKLGYRVESLMDQRTGYQCGDFEPGVPPVHDNSSYCAPDHSGFSSVSAILFRTLSPELENID